MFPLSQRRLAVFLIGFAVFMAGCGRSPEDTPEAAANAFFAAIARGDAKAAYASASFGFQSSATLESFQANCQDLGLFGAQPPVWTSVSTREKESILGGVITNQSGKASNLSATMVVDKGVWKFYALHTDAAGTHEAENRFTLVGKGSDFRDVYRQPMPAPAAAFGAGAGDDGQVCRRHPGAELRAVLPLRGTGMAGRHRPDGVDSGKLFDTSRDTICDLVADGRISVPLLQSNFGGFIEKKVDLTPMSRTAPVFTARRGSTSTGR